MCVCARANFLVQQARRAHGVLPQHSQVSKYSKSAYKRAGSVLVVTGAAGAARNVVATLIAGKRLRCCLYVTRRLLQAADFTI